MLLPRYGLPSPFSNSNEIIHPRNRIGSHFRRTKDPEKDEDFVKGETRERAPEALLLSPRGPIRPIDDEIKANAGLDRDSKSSRNVPQRLRYAFTIGISVLFPFIFFFFFYSTPVHVAPWPPLFRLHKFHVETPGTEETWNFDWENDPHESSTIPINFPFRTFDNWRGIERGHRDKTWKSQRFERGELPIRERIGLNQQAYDRMLIFEIIEILSFYERIVHVFESIIDVIHSKWTVARRVDVKFSHGWSNAWLVKLRDLSLISRSIRFESTSRMDAA